MLTVAYVQVTHALKKLGRAYTRYGYCMYTYRFHRFAIPPPPVVVARWSAAALAATFRVPSFADGVLVLEQS